MNVSCSARNQSLRRLLIASSLVVSFAIFYLATAETPGAQDKDDQKSKKDQPTKPKPIREEEESTKPKIKKPLRLDDDLDNGGREPGRAGLSNPSDLDNLAKDTKHKTVQDLFKSLAKVRDVVTMKAGGALAIDPVAPYLGKALDADKTLEVQPYDESGKRKKRQTLQLKDVSRVQSYEESTLIHVEGFLANKDVPRPDMLQAAEVALDTVLRYHVRAREKKVRQGDAWNNVEKNVRSKLLSVQQDLLVEYAKGNNWDAAFETAKRLAAITKDQEQRAKASKQLAQIVADSLKKAEYKQARRRQKALEELFPGIPVEIPITKELEEQVHALMEKAKAEKDPVQAMRWVRDAENIWPDLPELKKLDRQLAKAYPILRVGVPELPENLSPATAFSDTEKQAVELIFESLVKPDDDPAFGQRYFPGLAIGRPKLIPRGRQFQLAPDAKWSDSEENQEHRVSANDVTRTVQLLRDPNWPGFSPEWAELLENPTPGGDPYVVNLTLRQGLLDPLAQMTFKVLPALQLDKPDDPKFAKNPIGSGPFMYDKHEAGEAKFLANPYYHRADKPGLPHIQEIHFFHSDDPAADFSAGKLHLLLDLPTERIKNLKGLKNVAIQTLPNRRIYFLAVNHQSRQLKNENLRRAIALAINRTQILDDVFRVDLKGSTNPPHRPLNGLYPLGSWAADPSLPADPFNLPLARAQANLARQEFTLVKLRLKYPEGDNRVKRACEAIRDQVAALDPNIRLELEPKPARLLHKEVESGHDFDLAYYHYDFPSEAYWAWPLFDPSERATGKDGPNYLGYKNADLAGLFIRAMNRRQFAEVQKLTHQIDALVNKAMPLIPLWQLDTHLAVHEDLTPVRVDPLLIFPAVEEWRLEKK